MSRLDLVAPWPTLGHYWGGSLYHPILITAFLRFQLEGHQEPCNKVRSLSLAKYQRNRNSENKFFTPTIQKRITLKRHCVLLTMNCFPISLTLMRSLSFPHLTTKTKTLAIINPFVSKIRLYMPVQILTR